MWGKKAEFPSCTIKATDIVYIWNPPTFLAWDFRITAKHETLEVAHIYGRFCQLVKKVIVKKCDTSNILFSANMGNDDSSASQATLKKKRRQTSKLTQFKVLNAFHFLPHGQEEDSSEWLEADMFITSLQIHTTVNQIFVYVRVSVRARVCACMCPRVVARK